MRYVLWSLLALGSYSLVAPLVSVASQDVPSDVVALITNAMLVVGAAGVVLYRDQPVVRYLSHEQAPAMYLAGLMITIGIIAYYRALATGPVSVVTPIFGLFLVVSSAVGIVALDEPLTARKGLGIVFAVLAVYLTAVE